ncbi:MAG: glucosamine-6-phosphate deaminase [Planctomycetota bacterium]
MSYRTLTAPLFDLRVVDDPSTAQHAVAEEIARLLEREAGREEGLVLGLATGSTMVGVYDELARRHAAGGATFGRARAVLLDEYRGLPADHPQRFANWIRGALLDRVDLPAEQLEVPPADAPGAELEAACSAFDRRLRALGGVDLQLLGLGRNGHVAFNEPGSPLDSTTRLVRLAESSREANSAAFGSLDATPTSAVTQGLATIRAARRVRLLAFGASKRDALARLLELHRFDPDRPASALGGHQDLEVWVDEAALGGNGG